MLNRPTITSTRVNRIHLPRGVLLGAVEGGVSQAEGARRLLTLGHGGRGAVATRAGIRGTEHDGRGDHGFAFGCSGAGRRRKFLLRYYWRR